MRSGTNIARDQASVLLTEGVKIVRYIRDQSRILYGIKSEYYVRSGKRIM